MKSISYKTIQAILACMVFLLAGNSTITAQDQDADPLITIWQLAYWADYATACSIYVPSDIAPTENQIMDACGADILNLWKTTPICNRTYAKDDDNTLCTGLFLRRIGQQPLSQLSPKKNENQQNLPHFRIVPENANCIPGEICNAKPEIILRGESMDGAAIAQKIRIRVQGFEGECDGNECHVRLPLTGEQGEWLEFWHMDEKGNQGEHGWIKFRVINKSADNEAYRYDLISESYPKAAPFGSSLWYIFPDSNEQLDRVLEKPLNADYLTTTNKLSILAGKLIQRGFVDGSSCPHYGLQDNHAANGCGEEVAAEQMYAWQNKYNDMLFAAGERYHMPARVVKGILAQESQFWPESNVINEYGLGMLTENGVDLLLRWNTAFFIPICSETFSKDTNRCHAGYSNLSKEDQESLRGKTMRLIGTDQEIDLITATLKASAFQMNQLVSNVTGKSVAEVATYGDMWKFTIANYYSGSGCLYNAMILTQAYQKPLTWESVKPFLSGACRNTILYIQRVYDLG